MSSCTKPSGENTRREPRGASHPEIEEAVNTTLRWPGPCSENYEIELVIAIAGTLLNRMANSGFERRDRRYDVGVIYP